jgi:hypothetical protein
LLVGKLLERGAALVLIVLAWAILAFALLDTFVVYALRAANT